MKIGYGIKPSILVTSIKKKKRLGREELSAWNWERREGFPLTLPRLPEPSIQCSGSHFVLGGPSQSEQEVAFLLGWDSTPLHTSREEHLGSHSSLWWYIDIRLELPSQWMLDIDAQKLPKQKSPTPPLDS